MEKETMKCHIIANSDSSLGLDRSGKAQTPELLVSLELKPLLVAESPHLKYGGGYLTKFHILK